MFLECWASGARDQRPPEGDEGRGDKADAALVEERA